MYYCRPVYAGLVLSELEENKWAVISERGREATDLTYEEARRQVLQLAGEGRHGLCIVTNEVAERLALLRESDQSIKVAG